MDLPEDEVHVWYTLPDEIEGGALLAAYERLMLPEERARRDRYRFEASRREYLFTRALVRATLSRYAPVAPAAWTFRANEYGRPAIAAPGPSWLRFNLSNTHGLIACAVARDREVGVDVEDTTRSGETLEIAHHFFSPVETAALRALPPERQRARFFALWTLKEAYIKARGMGLAIPLDQFSFLLDDPFHGGAAGGPTPQAPTEPSPIRIAFDPRLADDPAAWQFERLAITERHATALAVRRGAGPELRVIVRRTVPLAT